MPPSYGSPNGGDGHHSWVPGRPIRGVTLPCLVVTAAVAAVIGTRSGALAAAAVGVAAHLLGTSVMVVAAVSSPASRADRRWEARRYVAGALAARPMAMVMSAIVIVASLTTWRAVTEHAAVDTVDVGLRRGWVTLIGSPVRATGGVRQIVSVDGRRFESWTRSDDGAPSSTAGNTAGDTAGNTAGDTASDPAGDPAHASDEPAPWSARRLYVLGETRLIDGEAGRRRRMDHVVGRLIIHRVIATAAGSPLDRWRARVRSVISAGADRIGDDQRSLFLGLVIGDRDQPDRRVTERFRESGLAHLSVASGHDVALVLVVVAPVMVRLRPLARWAMTVLVVAAFADLVGSEPSITRAAVMAIIAASGHLGGLRWRSLDLVMIATVVLVVVDPFLVHLPGFWMSVGATAGVVALGPPIARRLARRPDHPGRIASALSVTLGAQAGVALPLVATFGSVPLVALPANLVAVPLGSAIKVYGLPAAIVSGLFPAIGGVVMAPVGPMVRALDRIAAVAADLEPEPRWSLLGWLLVALGVMIGRRSWTTRVT